MSSNTQQDDNLSPEESPAHSPNQSRRSGRNGFITIDPSTTNAPRLSSYQQLLEGSDIYNQAGDETAQNENAGHVLPLQFRQVEFDGAPAEKMMDGSNRGSIGSIGSVGTTDDEPSASKDNKEREPGLLGSDGLLAMPHVKMVLLLGSVVSVRRTTTEIWP